MADIIAWHHAAVRRIGRFVNEYEFELGIGAVLIVLAVGAFNFCRAIGAL